VAQVEEGEARVEIAYRRGVRPEGNPKAIRIMEQVFEIGSAQWRGLGEIVGSGLKLRSDYQEFDAERAFNIVTEAAREPEGCLCGEILRGVKMPLDCSLFGRACTPEHPVGPCMVSSEGSCAAYYLYGGSLEG
jgi:hydrogenase expression/formation protein HypD